MTSNTFELPFLIDAAATFLWALTGGLLAARQGYDVVGIFFIALASSAGGGLMRDGIFLQAGPPALVRTPIYLELVTAATIAVQVWGRHSAQLGNATRFIEIVDALGLGGYAVVGMTKALDAGIDLFGVVLIGILNAVGGGILRDMLLRRDPDLFKPTTIQALAVLGGCVLFLGLIRTTEMPLQPAAWLTIGFIFALRVLALRYGWRTRPVATD